MSRVAVLKGGGSLERQVSLRSGAQVEDALARLGHDVVADRRRPRPRRRACARTAPDVAFVALHGRDGEDGTVQELLEILGIPYTGSGVSACMRCADKVLAKHAMLDAGLPTPDFFSFTETAFKELGAADALGTIEERLEFPIVVKPADQGSALGISFARSPEDVPPALVAAFSYSHKVAARAPRPRARPRGLGARRRCPAGRRGGAARGGLLRLLGALHDRPHGVRLPRGAARTARPSARRSSRSPSSGCSAAGASRAST